MWFLTSEPLHQDRLKGFPGEHGLRDITRVSNRDLVTPHRQVGLDADLIGERVRPDGLCQPGYAALVSAIPWFQGDVGGSLALQAGNRMTAA